MSGRGYKGTRHRPLPTHSSCPVLPAPLPRSSRPPPARRLQPAWTPRAPPDGRHRPTGRRASGRPPRPAGSAGVKWPSKRSSAIGAGDSLAERPARPPAGLPPACPDPRLDRGAAPEPGSRQVSAPWPRGGSPARGFRGLVGEGIAAGSRDCREGIPFRDLLGRRLPSGWRPGMLGEEKSLILLGGNGQGG